jgi:arabinose-5-phosphate isomerase
MLVKDIMTEDLITIESDKTALAAEKLLSINNIGRLIIQEEGQIVGIITDGDLRRMLSQDKDLSQIQAKDIMSESPKTITEDAMAVEAVKVMKNTNISQLLVVSADEYVGVVHFHDLLKEGLIY